MFVRGQLALCVLALASSGSECGLGGRGRDPERLLLPVQPSRAGRGVTPGFGTWHAGQASPEQQPTERAHAGARRVWCLGSVCEVYAPGAAHATAEAENAHGLPAASRRPGRPTAENLRRSRGPGRTGVWLAGRGTPLPQPSRPVQAPVGWAATPARETEVFSQSAGSRAPLVHKLPHRHTPKCTRPGVRAPAARAAQREASITRGLGGRRVTSGRFQPRLVNQHSRRLSSPFSKITSTVVGKHFFKITLFLKVSSISIPGTTIFSCLFCVCRKYTKPRESRR